MVPTRAGPVGDSGRLACLFCEIIAGERPAHVVLDEGDVFAFLDTRPLFPGHTLLVPKAHYETLIDLPSELLPPLFGAKEGRIARANCGRDPLYLFAALQRQLGYPVVPRPRPHEEGGFKIETLQAKIRDLETRLKLVEGEVRGQVDLTQFGKPELLADSDDDE